MGVNISILMGRLTADPELKNTSNGTSVTSFTMAVDRGYQKAGEERKADFIDVVAWRNTADFVCKYFRKGSMIIVQGELQTRIYEDKNGNKRKAVEVVASNVSFGEVKAKDSSTPAAAPGNDAAFANFAANAAAMGVDVEYSNDLPF